jgi:hypothetical protein
MRRVNGGGRISRRNLRAGLIRRRRPEWRGVGPALLAVEGRGQGEPVLVERGGVFEVVAVYPATTRVERAKTFSIYSISAGD